MLVREDVLQVRAPALCFYVLRGSDGLYLIDGGFIGGRYLLRRALRQCGWEHLPIKGILITHGHLDHVLNVATISKETGAWIAAPRLDALHYAGRYAYRNFARVCGWLEAVGRPLFRYRTFSVDHWLDDLSVLPIWHGLTAIHLPGHTEGHMGFYCAPLRLLFSADLFASYGENAHLPPAIFNDKPELIPASVSRAVSLDLTGVLPNHGDSSSPATHLERLKRLRRKMS